MSFERTGFDGGSPALDHVGVTVLQTFRPEPNPAVLQHDSGTRVRLRGDPADQLHWSAHLNGAGFRLLPYGVSGGDTSNGDIIAYSPGTPPAVFYRALEPLRKTTPDGTDLLHPVARAGFTGLPDTGRFAVTGYSGHGNMVVQALLRAIDDTVLGPDEKRSRPAAVEQLRIDADHHSQALRAACTELFQTVAHELGTGFRDYVVAPGQAADCTVRARFENGETLVLGGVPYAGFVGHDFGAHSFWDERVARFFDRFGYRWVYLVVRDPLAGLASNAAKTTRPLERVLHDKAWFEQAARETAEYLEAADPFRDRFTLLRFEDLLREPVSTITRLAEHAGYELTESQAKDIWDRVGFKPVTDAGVEHLVDPLADKRKHFRRAHLALMDGVGLTPWFERFGYTPPKPDDLEDAPLNPERANAADEKTATPSTLYGRLNPVTLTHRTLENQRVLIRATSPGLADAIQRVLPRHPFALFLRTLGDAFSDGVSCPPRLVS